MAILSRTRLYWATAILAFVAAFCSGCYGILLLVASVSPSGSAGGNAILGLAGVLFLLVSAVLVFSGDIALRKHRSI